MEQDNTEVFRDQLLEDEEILWIGQPEASVHFTQADLLLIPLSIWLGAYTIYSGLLFIRAMLDPRYGIGQVILLLFAGLPFLLVGVYVTIGRFIYKAWRKTRTFYAVTNQRVLAIAQIGYRRLNQLPLEEITSLEKHTGPGSTGTITFGGSMFSASWCGNTGMNCLVGFDKAELIAFHDIKQADQVYELITALKAGQSSNGEDGGHDQD